MSKRAKITKKVAIVAPGFPPAKDVQAQIGKFIKSQSQFGKHLNFHLPSHLIQTNPMFANSEEKRAQYLTDALADDSNDIIWCLRGGYGSLPLLPYLKKMKKPKKSKCLVGLSDITSLHLFLNQTWGWPSVHGSNLDRWVNGTIPANVLKELNGILDGSQAKTTYKNIKPVNALAKKLKSVKGKITGGNLVTLCSHLGTPFQPRFENQFLFIEDIGERGYRIDRCLTQLTMSGVLKGCRGILVGQFTSCLEPDGRNLWSWVIKKWADTVNIPVYSGIPSGHEIQQWPLSFGTLAEVKIINDRGHLIIENETW